MGWQRYNRGTKIFEVSDDNGATWLPLSIAATSLSGIVPQANFPNPVAVPFNASMFAVPTGTWVVTAGNIGINSYVQFGKTVIYSLAIINSTITGAPGYLIIDNPCPGRGSVYGAAFGNLFVAASGNDILNFATVPGDSLIYVVRSGSVAFPAGVIGRIIVTLITMVP